MSASTDEEADYLSDDHSSSASSSSSSSSPPQRPAGPVPTNFFAPPFYGRPPTPLPPSPSLTSLLRPSRPTTPDASDDNDHQHAHTHHHNHHNHNHHYSADGHHHHHHAGPPVQPHAAPRVPTYEYYGFVLYLLSGLAFLAYLLWSYLPSPFLHGLGIYYYPDRWWALATPAYLVMTLVYIYVALASYNLEMLTLPLRRVETIVDDAGQLAVVDAEGKLRGSNSSRNRQSIEVGGGAYEVARGLERGNGCGAGYTAVGGL
ncbi:subunit P of phosphatidylinositol N-acetylglucosaminyltransferase [Beauveria brongniartii RCEF 3172]|uniref:Subunit P of phosphatidylinositol N-acetylglucosaminyltransferase n=1 Tax=Beauveria brongniartii RCEF 3172 TaxID=1081107 RepID=A0A167EX03_9HYPO|nr:subunit P of phosphatidylinositol N-acetylglucosaminyltransferase [Beauveria brongniartii RCEF 3172]